MATPGAERWPHAAGVTAVEYDRGRMRHVMKVGPLSLERGTASAYVAFGEVGLDVVAEADDDKGLAALERRNKGEVLVCEPSLSRAAGRRGLTVAAPPPAAVSMKATLAVGLDHGRALADVSPELILELIRATLDFAAAAPWRSFEPDEAIAIRIEPGGRELEGCVLGQAGEESGLALYHQPGGIKKVIAFADAGRPEQARSLDATTMLIERDDPFVVDVIAEMAGVALAPRVLHLTKGKLTPATAHDVAGLIAALRAVTALATGEADASGRSTSGQRPVVAHATRAPASEHRPTSSNYEAVGRNEPCPCGSGKKFKRCHLDAGDGREPATAPLHVRDQRVVSDIAAFGARRFGADVIARVMEQRFGPRGASRQLMGPLVAYELPFDGKPLALHFLESAGKGLSADDRTWIERQLQTRLSIWEVLSVERGKGMDVVDLLSGDRCFVDENLGSQTTLPRLAVLGRVVRGERNVFCGMHETPLGPMEADRVVQKAHGASLGTTELLEAWHDAAEDVDQQARTPMTVRNTDGHDLANVEDVFSIARGAFQRVVHALAALDGVVVDDHRAKNARLTFTRPGNAVHPSWAHTVVGTARLTPTRLVVTTNSLERAEALAQRLRAELATLVTWKKREREALPVMLGGQTVTMDAQAIGTASATDAFREWLDAVSPLLEGRSPRQAVADEAGRRTVHVMLKDLEYRHALRPLDGIDPMQWRRELGLDQLGQPMADRELDRSMGAGRKLSDTLLDFAGPMMDAAPVTDARSMRTLLEFSVRIWNAMVDEEAGGAAGYLGAIRAELVSSGAPSEIIAWHDKLVARKRGRFSGDLRFVGNWDLQQVRGGFHVEMETRVSPAIHAKLKSRAQAST